MKGRCLELAPKSLVMVHIVSGGPQEQKAPVDCLRMALAISAQLLFLRFPISSKSQTPELERS